MIHLGTYQPKGHGVMIGPSISYYSLLIKFNFESSSQSSHNVIVQLTIEKSFPSLIREYCKIMQLKTFLRHKTLIIEGLQFKM